MSTNTLRQGQLRYAMLIPSTGSLGVYVTEWDPYCGYQSRGVPYILDKNELFIILGTIATPTSKLIPIMTKYRIIYAVEDSVKNYSEPCDDK